MSMPRLEQKPASAETMPVWSRQTASIEYGSMSVRAVRGSVRRRFFRTGGITQSRTEVVAADIVEAGKRRQVQRVLRLAAEKLGGQPTPAVRST